MKDLNLKIFHVSLQISADWLFILNSLLKSAYQHANTLHLVKYLQNIHFDTIFTVNLDKLLIDIYFPGKLSILISFGQMCSPLYKQGVLRKIMECDFRFFIMQADSSSLLKVYVFWSVLVKLQQAGDCSIVLGDSNLS